MFKENIILGRMTCPRCGMQRGTDLSPCACGYDPKTRKVNSSSILELFNISERELLNKEQEKLICPHCQYIKDNADDICKACGFNPKTGQIEKYWSSDTLKYPFVEEEEKSRIKPNTPYPIPTMPFTQMGWVCPKCGSVYAPNITSCWRCSNNTYKPFEVWC